MALKQYVGRAAIVAGQATVTVVSTTPTNVIGVSVGGRSELYTIPSGTWTTAALAANLYAQLVASTAPEFLDLSFSYTAGASTIGVTARDVGTDFTIAAAGTSLATTVTGVVAASGPGDPGAAANWSGGTLPANGDDIVFDLPNCAVNLNLAALAAISPASVTVTNRHNRGVGLVRFRRAAGSAGYLEYRTRFLTFAGVTRFVVDDAAPGVTGPGPAVAAVAASAGSTTSFINSANGQDNDGESPILLGFSGASNVVNVVRGMVENVADAIASITGTAATVKVGRDGDDGEVPQFLNSGTVTALTNYSGISASKTATTLTMGRQAVSHTQTGGNLTVTASGGVCHYRTAGTVTATMSNPGCRLDLEGSTEAKTVHSSSTFRNGAAIYDRNGTSSGSTASFDGPSAQASRLRDSISATL